MFTDAVGLWTGEALAEGGMRMRCRRSFAIHLSVTELMLLDDQGPECDTDLVIP